MMDIMIEPVHGAPQERIGASRRQREQPVPERQPCADAERVSEDTTSLDKSSIPYEPKKPRRMLRGLSSCGATL